jgi:hypothetical protein
MLKNYRINEDIRYSTGIVQFLPDLSHQRGKKNQEKKDALFDDSLLCFKKYFMHTYISGLFLYESDKIKTKRYI